MLEHLGQHFPHFEGKRLYLPDLITISAPKFRKRAKMRRIFYPYTLSPAP